MYWRRMLQTLSYEGESRPRTLSLTKVNHHFPHVNVTATKQTLQGGGVVRDLPQWGPGPG